MIIFSKSFWNSGCFEKIRFKTEHKSGPISKASQMLCSPPVIVLPNKEGVSEVHWTENEKGHLRCSASGDPTPKYSFTVENRMFISSTSTVTVRLHFLHFLYCICNCNCNCISQGNTDQNDIAIHKFYTFPG